MLPLSQLVNELFQDARHTVRLWTKQPLQTFLAILALAIGIGANVGIFSVMNTLLWQALPFTEVDRLALIRSQDFIPPHDTAEQLHSWRANSRYIIDATLTEEKDVNLEVYGAASRAHAAQTSSNFFAVLGTRPIVGRTFLAGEDSPEKSNIVVISYGAWESLFGASTDVLGKSIRLDGYPLTIVGVVPRGFDYPHGAALWKPATFQQGNNGWETIARIKPDVTWDQARAAFEIEASVPNRIKSQRKPEILPLREALAGPAKNASFFLMMAMLLVLLVACTNLANLLMARTADRSAELSIRSALGASRARVYRQLLTECLLLSIVSGISGLIVAQGIAAVAYKLEPPASSLPNYSVLDIRVLGFAFALSVVSSALFGLLPAWWGVRVAQSPNNNAVGHARYGRWIRETLLASQVMLVVILLTASVSVGRGFVDLMTADRGYDLENVVTINVSLEGTKQEASKGQLAYFKQVLTQLRALPYVRAASATDFLPLYATGFIGGRFGIDGRGATRNSMQVPILSDYFKVMGTRIVAGREFTQADIEAGARVAIVNERFAREFGEPDEVLGRQLTVERGQPRTIIGVVRGTEYETDSSLADSNQVFIPSSAPGGFFSTFVVRVDGDVRSQMAQIRDTIRMVDTGVPVFGMKTMKQRLDEFYARPEAYRTTIWIFSGFALILVVIGIYGIVSYGIIQRMRELGIRLALGSTSAKVRTMLLQQALIPIFAGAMPGVAAAFLAGRYLKFVIEGIKPVEGMETGVAVALVIFTCVISLWLATRRLASVDVMQVLRAQ